MSVRYATTLAVLQRVPYFVQSLETGSVKYRNSDLSRRITMSGSLVTPGTSRPRILISNDDGINAPGLRALVAELHVEEFCDIIVCSPSGERSAQSHAITLGKDLVCTPITIDGSVPSLVRARGYPYMK